MTTLRRPGVPHALTLAAGLALGWLTAGGQPAPIRAGGGDRFDESILTAGPVYVRYNEGTKVQVPTDALYYLDYRTGRLLATIPSFKRTTGNSKVIESFVERDLVADFKIDIDTGPRPHFLMTTGSIATGVNNVYADGWAPLYVVEAVTRQVATYKVQEQVVGTTSRPVLELLEIRPFGRTPTAGR